MRRSTPSHRHSPGATAAILCGLLAAVPAALFAGLLAAVPATLLAISAFTLPASAASLEIVRVLGEDDDDLLLHRPSHVVFSDDGSAYVLNRGDCTILHMSPDWEPLSSFGRMGEGPGEFSQPTGFAMHDGRLLVFDFTRIVVFDLDGNYLETIQTGHETQAVTAIAGSLYARLGTGPHAATRITPRGEIELPIGPQCPTDDFFARFQQCGTIEILPHPEHLCALINPFQAEVMTIAGDGSIAQTFKVPEGPGDLQTASAEGGMSMSLTMTFSISHLDSRGRYWKIPYRDGGPRSVVLLDAGFRETGETIRLPEEIESHRFAESPRGEILAIQGRSSKILICGLVGD